MDDEVFYVGGVPYNPLLHEDEVVFVGGVPYMTINEYGCCSPIHTVTHVGQKVQIDWTQDSIYAPENVPKLREFQVTEIFHKTCFRGYTVGAPSRNITEIYFDARGGWTEVLYDTEQERELYYSHPILTFIIEVCGSS